MESHLFLQYLCDHSLEEGRSYIQAQSTLLTDVIACGILMKEEAQRQEQTAPLIALKLAELLISFGEYRGHVPSRALGLMAKGNILKTIGYQQAALICLDEAGEAFLSVGDEVGWGRSRISWIISASWVGRVEEALQQADRARELFNLHAQPYWNCVIDHNIAVIYTQQGRYQAAIESYERMLVTYPTLRNQSEQQIAHHMAMAQVNQSRCLALIGSFERAYDLQRQAQQTFLRLDEAFQVANTEYNLAEFDYAQGYYGSALHHYYAARDGLMQYCADDSPLLVHVRMNLAECLMRLNRMQEAGELAAKAVEGAQQLGISLEIGEVLRRYAKILHASGRMQQAVAVLDQAGELFTRGHFEHYACGAKLQRAEMLLELGLCSEAYQLAQEVRAFFEQKGLVSHAVRANLVIAGSLIEQVQQIPAKEPSSALLQHAAQLCHQAFAQARQHNLQEQVYLCQHLLGRLAVLEGKPERAGRHYISAIAQVERMLKDLAHDLSPAFLHTTWTVYEDLIALYLQQGRKEAALGFLERGRSLVLRQYLANSHHMRMRSSRLDARSQQKSVEMLRLQRELEECQQAYRRYSTQLVTFATPLAPSVDKDLIVGELKRYEARLSELFERLHLQALATSTVAPDGSSAVRQRGLAVLPVDIAQVRRGLAPQQLLLAYFLYRGRLVVFAATRERLMTYELPDGVAQIEYLLPLLHAHLQPAGWHDPQKPPMRVIQRMLQKLYTLLIAPVAEFLPVSGSLTIVPYGPLHGLPFHALYNGERYLIETLPINYLPAASMLVPAQAAERELVTQGRKPLIMGYAAKKDLPRAIEEAKTLSTLLGGQCYLDEEATITRLIEHAESSSIIHLATHGRSRLDAPNFSSVILADGPLNALDAFGLDLKGCTLVTLSGCETGLALSGGGDEQLGLGRAFLAAGASSLVMSLWPVEDAATSILMQRFYQRLLAGEDKAQALRAAQCSFLHEDQAETQHYAHPYFWSAFRLVGNTSPLRLA